MADVTPEFKKAVLTEVDHDLGDELQHDHEAFGLGWFLGLPVDEGDSVFVHQHSGSHC